MTHTIAPRCSLALLAATLVALPSSADAQQPLSSGASSSEPAPRAAEGPAPAPAASTTTAPAPATTPGGDAAARCQDRTDLPWIRRCRPERNTFELGVFGGVFFTGGSAHELFDPHRQLASLQDGDPNTQFFKPYRTAAAQIGGRVGFYPLTFLGGELEAAVMPTRIIVDGEPRDRANLFNFRGNVIGQLPFWRVTPFVLVGGGGLGTAGALGHDIDQSVYFGGGVKFFLNHRTLIRLDVRDVVAGGRKQAQFA